jgi:hypothetical protein
MTIGNLHVWTVWHPSPNPETYNAHWRKFKTNNNRVYWGVINKKNDFYKDEFANYLKNLKTQLTRKEHTYIFIVPEDHSRYIGGEIFEIHTGQEFITWRDSALVPEYYKDFDPECTDYMISYWFRLVSFGWLDPLKYELYVKPSHIHKRAKHGEAGRPYPSVCEYTGSKKLEKLFVTHTEIMRNENGSNTNFQHSENYRMVFYKGKKYSLTPLQAATIQILHERHRNGFPEVSQHKILEEINSKSKQLKDLFKKCHLWKNLIIKGERKDTVRLSF